MKTIMLFVSLFLPIMSHAAGFMCFESSNGGDSLEITLAQEEKLPTLSLTLKRTVAARTDRKTDTIELADTLSCHFSLKDARIAYCDDSSRYYGEIRTTVVLSKKVIENGINDNEKEFMREYFVLTVQSPQLTRLNSNRGWAPTEYRFPMDNCRAITTR